MIININDIPTSGKDFNFEIDLTSLNQRINGVNSLVEEGNLPLPEYRFKKPPQASLHIYVQGTSVFINGRASGVFLAPCSRCLEHIETSLSTKIQITLKPRPKYLNNQEQDEDVGFGYYIGDEINCADLVEEQLILNLPQTITCSFPSVTQCPKASARIKELCKNSKDKEGDERMAIFRTLKVN